VLVHGGGKSITQRMREAGKTPRFGDPACGAIFALPPATADYLGYSDLARSLDPRAFYGFTFLEGEDRIALYAELIQNSPAAEPYCLFGYSSGGNLAYHVANALEARGQGTDHQHWSLN
jgi:thioesterase domain-containing protein